MKRCMSKICPESLVWLVPRQWLLFENSYSVSLFVLSPVVHSNAWLERPSLVSRSRIIPSLVFVSFFLAFLPQVLRLV